MFISNENKSPDIPDVEYRGIPRPGLFSCIADADSRRKEFDIKNQCLIFHKQYIDFLFIGDSITDFWDLNTYFDCRNNFIVNRGIGGDIISNLKRRFYADCVQLNPKYVILQIGINDANALEPNIWKALPGKSLDSVISKAQSDYTQLLEIMEDYQIKPIICSLLPTNMTFSPVNKERQLYVLAMNQFLSTYCKTKDLIFIDYFKELVKDDGVSIIDNITQEGLHPLVHGYDIMADTLRNTLAKFSILL